MGRWGGRDTHVRRKDEGEERVYVVGRRGGGRVTERMCETERERGRGRRETQRITKDRRRIERDRQRQSIEIKRARTSERSKGRVRGGKTEQPLKVAPPLKRFLWTFTLATVMD